jgi:hypothetical protein
MAPTMSMQVVRPARLTMRSRAADVRVAMPARRVGAVARKALLVAADKTYKVDPGYCALLLGWARMRG